MCTLFWFFSVSAPETFPYIELGVTPGREMFHFGEYDVQTVVAIFPFLFSLGREVIVR